MLLNWLEIIQDFDIIEVYFTVSYKIDRCRIITSVKNMRAFKLTLKWMFSSWESVKD